MRPILKIAGTTAALAAGAYAAYVGITWCRYGQPCKGRKADKDPLLDAFIPTYDVVERRSTFVRAPADVTMAAGCEMRLEDSPMVRATLWGRKVLLRSKLGGDAAPQGLLAATKALGWVTLAEVPGREVVMGAVTQPWESDVVFRSIPPADFAAFADPGFVKIVWTLRADPVSESTSVFRTETRVLACGPVPRSKFRKYWAFLSPGIILIRLAMLAALRREAERRAREPLPLSSPA